MPASEELGLYLEAFEVMSAAALDLVKTHMPAVMIPMAAEHPWIVLIELGGATPETDDLSARLTDFLAKALEDNLISDATLSANDQQRQSFWALRDAIPAAEKKEGIAVKQDISVPLNAVIDYHLEAAPRLEKFCRVCALLLLAISGTETGIITCCRRRACRKKNFSPVARLWPKQRSRPPCHSAGLLRQNTGLDR